MRRHTLIGLGVGCLVTAAGLVSAAGPPLEEAIRKDRAIYQGTWRVASLESNGNRAVAQDAQHITVVNHADGTWVARANGDTFWKGTSTIDPTRTPKTIDFVPTAGTNAGETFLGIYELAGDTRMLCFAQPGKARPADFSSKPGSDHILVVFRRER